MLQFHYSKHRRIIFITLCAILLVGISQIFKNEKQSESQKFIPKVTVLNVGGDIHNEEDVYSGVVCGRYESKLAFQVGGKILNRYVEVGDSIYVGEILMNLDVKDLTESVNSLKAQLHSAQSKLNLAEVNLKRQKELLSTGAISQSQYDQTATEYDVTISEMNRIMALLSQAENQESYANLKSDVNGTISEITVEEGQVISAGQTVMTVVRDGEREIEIYVPENKLSQLKESLSISVSFWALPNLNLSGRLREISPTADSISKMYRVRISIESNSDVELGMTATAKVIERNLSDVFYLPLSAIYQNENIPCVWVVENNRTELRPIKLGNFFADKVEVTNGISRGDKVVLTGVHKLTQGQEVEITVNSNEIY